MNIGMQKATSQVLDLDSLEEAEHVFADLSSYGAGLYHVHRLYKKEPQCTTQDK